ncbi:MAG TPA: hypothetical protein VM186_07510 [Planctomycetota bacterium]|nr:hypothetical protein [Planctomycetota bacterium]
MDKQLQMIADVLNWPISAEKKINYLKMLLKESAPAPAAPKRAAPPKAAPPKAARAKRRGRPRMPTLRVRLWRELKQLAPEKAAGLDYTTTTAEKIQGILSEVKK